MSEQTHVSIYDVGDAGATGALLGSGTLIAPAFVLLHPPLNQRLAGSGNSVRLRVGIASTGTESDIVEVIDGDKLHVSPVHTREPLVGLELLHRAAAPVAPLSPVGDDAKATADLLVHYLASLPGSCPDGEQVHAGHLEGGPKHQDPFKPVSTDDFPWCQAFPNGPGCTH